MDSILTIPVDEEVVELLVGRGKDRKMVSHMLSKSMIPLTWFAYMANVPLSRLSQFTDPTDARMDIGYPFQNIKKGKFEAFSGKKFIIINEKSLNYLKHRRYGNKRKVSKQSMV